MTALDQFGNASSGYSGSVTVALGNNPGNAALGGALTAAVNPVTGVATFSGLTLSAAGTGYTLTVSSGNLTAAVTSPFTVSGAAATQLQVIGNGLPSSPVFAGAGSANTFSLSVSATDPGGNVDTTYNGLVTLKLAANPGGSTLGGTLSVAAVNGVATFSNLTLNTPGVGYTVTATSGILTQLPATAPITVVPGPLAQFVVSSQPPSTAVSMIAFSTPVSFTAEDAAGNVLSTYTTPVTAVVGTGPAGGTLGGNTTVTPINGVATFTGLSLNKAGAYTLTTQAISGVTAGTTSTITVSPAGLAALVVTNQPNSVTANTTTFPSTFSLVVSGADASGNPVGSLATSTVTLAPRPAPAPAPGRHPDGDALGVDRPGDLHRPDGAYRRHPYTIKATSNSQPDRGDDHRHHRHARVGHEAGGDDAARADRHRRRGDPGRVVGLHGLGRGCQQQR